MTRIVAGQAGGRRLNVPGTGTRPTSDRVREAVFSALVSTLGTLSGRRALDLYAGSGAVGLEALSRGASEALLVESDRRACAVIKDNATTLALAGRCEVRCAPVLKVLTGQPPMSGFAVVFADPPYALSDGDLHTMLVALVDGRWVEPGGVVVVERSVRSAPVAWPPGLDGGRRMTYGDTAVSYARTA